MGCRSHFRSDYRFETLFLNRGRARLHCCRGALSRRFPIRGCLSGTAEF